MKCKKCGSIIKETDINCPGCTTSVEDLTLNGLIEAEEPKKEETLFEEPKKEKKKHNGFLIFLILILVALAGSVWFYFLVLCSPKMILEKTASSVIASYKKEIEVAFSEKQSGSIVFSIDYKANEEDEMLDFFKNLGFRMDYNVDFNKKEAYVKMDATYKKESALSIEAFSKNDNNVYIRIPEYLDKVLRQEEWSFKDRMNYADYTYILEKTKKVFFDCVSKEHYSSSKEELTISGETKKVRKSSIILSSSEIQKVAKEIKETLKADERYVKAVANISNLSEVEVRNSLTKELKLDGGIEIHVYTTGYTNEFLKLEMINEDNKSLSIEKNSSERYNYEIQFGDYQTQGVVLIQNNMITVQANCTVDDITLELTVELHTTHGEEIPNFDTTNSITMEELIEDGYLEIQDKFLQNPVVSDFISQIMPYFENMGNSDFDIDTDIDFGDMEPEDYFDLETF